jgi:hypothetical protein
MMRPFTLRQIVTLLAAVGVAALVGGCGRTLVFAENDGVNFAIRTNAASSTPVEVNFGLSRAVGSIVPPAGQKGGRPSGDAVNMFAGFQVDNSLVPDKKIDADLQIDTQFASGQAAVAVADKPKVVARIINPNSVTFSSSESSRQLEAWLWPGGKFSQTRSDTLQAWLIKRYPTKRVRPAKFLDDDEDGEYEAGRVAALKDAELMDTP